MQVIIPLMYPFVSLAQWGMGVLQERTHAQTSMSMEGGNLNTEDEWVITDWKRIVTGYEI